MEQTVLTFEKLPEAVAYLVTEVNDIRRLLEQQRQPLPSKRLPIGIEDACRVVMKARSTVYTLVRKGLIPCCKNGNRLYFYEDELLAWIANGKKKSIAETKAEIEAQMKRSVRHKPAMRNL